MRKFIVSEWNYADDFLDFHQIPDMKNWHQFILLYLQQFLLHSNHFIVLFITIPMRSVWANLYGENVFLKIDAHRDI